MASELGFAWLMVVVIVPVDVGVGGCAPRGATSETGSEGGPAGVDDASDAERNPRCPVCAQSSSCKCCPGGNDCLCTTPCETDAECTDSTRPACYGTIGRKFCVPNGDFCIIP